MLHYSNIYVSLLKMPQRLTELTHWLMQHFADMPFTLHSLPGDASFRRYFRLVTTLGSYIAVDAPPKTENSVAFIQIAEAFTKLDLNVPKVLAADLQQGFLLLSDLGDTVYFHHLNNQNADSLYKLALQNLAKIQQCKLELPLFDDICMRSELELFRQWVINTHLGLKLSLSEEELLKETFNYLLISATEQPQCCVHRDYHSRNLMLLSNGDLGILDFQDAVCGPVTYDAVSLLRDCYISWPKDQVAAWASYFYSLIKPLYPLIKETDFIRWFDLMGIQRHLKASFIFARKYHRDGVSSYLKDIPRALTYIVNVCAQYPELTQFRKWLIEKIASPIFGAHSTQTTLIT